MNITLPPASTAVCGPESVSSNVSCLTAIALREAVCLDLLHTADTAEAVALVARVKPLVEAAEARKRPRGPTERRKLAEALGAIVGGVLVASLRDGVAVYRLMSPGTFDGAIPYRQAKAALDAMTVAGLLHHYPGIRFQVSLAELGDFSKGKATRYEASGLLLGLAAEYSLTAETIAVAFKRVFPKRPAAVPHPLILKRHNDRTGRNGSRDDDVSFPVAPNDAVARAMRREIDAGNETLDRHAWENCQPPRLYRAFRGFCTGDWNYGGRWIVAGAMTVQNMKAADRLNILIDGEAVAEVDAVASHLSILAAYAGVVRLPDDPYDITGYERDVAKAAVVATLGSGKLPDRWPQRMREQNPALASVPIKPLAGALRERYSFLANPGSAIGVDKERVAVRLQFLEANIIGAAMVRLWARDIPVVPIHDSLLCPAIHADTVNRELIRAYEELGRGVVIRTKVKRP